MKANAVWVARAAAMASLVCLAFQEAAAGQQRSPAGSEFQVNDYTTNSQSASSVSTDAQGNFVVVWASDGSPGTDTLSYSIQAQRYASDGTFLGGQFQVNDFTTNVQHAPSVSMDADGDFVVVWHSEGSDGTDDSGRSIQGQRYASDGVPLGSQFQVNTYTTSYQDTPGVSLSADGDFVVVWGSYGSTGTDSSGRSIQAQRYASDGTLLGSQFQVNSFTTSNQVFPAVSLDMDGDFVVVWQSLGSSGTDLSDRSIQGQRYSSSGGPLASEFQINVYTSDRQTSPSVSLDADGDFVVVWKSIGSSGTDSTQSIQGRRYSSSGAALALEFQVNTTTTYVQSSPAVSRDGVGNFVVVWDSDRSSGTDSAYTSIQGQRYTSNGTSVGSEWQVNSFTPGDQLSPSVSLSSDGDFVVVWDSLGSGDTDSSSFSVQGQRYTDSIFADGFESGNSGAWTNTVP